MKKDGSVAKKKKTTTKKAAKKAPAKKAAEELVTQIHVTGELIQQMAASEPLIAAAIRVARVQCQQARCSDSCSGPWCGARGDIRKALDGLGVVWKLPPSEPKVAEPAPAPTA